MAYRYTKKESYIEDFRHVTGYFLEHLPSDLVPYWDLEFGEGSGEPRDSSSASIAACGMLEMAEYLEVTEEFLDDALSCYRKKYGIFTQVDHYLIIFEPSLMVMELV